MVTGTQRQRASPSVPHCTKPSVLTHTPCPSVDLHYDIPGDPDDRCFFPEDAGADPRYLCAVDFSDTMPKRWPLLNNPPETGMYPAIRGGRSLPCDCGTDLVIGTHPLHAQTWSTRATWRRRR